MNQDRLNEINRLSDLLWNEELECWHDEDSWRTILNGPCDNDQNLISDVCDFARTAKAVDPDGTNALPLPEEIGGHKIASLIGAGGMGTVYEAIFQGQGMKPRPVALKVVNKEGPETERVVRRLRAEINLLSGLNHPNVVQIYDAGTTEADDPFYIMELVEDGRAVDRYCTQNTLSLEERAALLQKVCDVVQHIHENNIIHRDLKPANILITSTGEPSFSISALPLQLSATRAHPHM
jgi:hypothetical protein